MRVFSLLVGEVPMVAIFTFIGRQGIDRQAVLKFNEASRGFGGFFVWVANLVLVADPAFFGLIRLRFVCARH